MTSRVLILCAANICRSPYAEFWLRDAVGTGGGTGLEFISAGVAARDGAPICETIGAALRSGGVTRHADRHRSRSFVGEDLDASLILAADRQVLRTVLRFDPQVRRRAFTVPQVAHLVGGLQAGPQTLDGLVDQLHRARERTATTGYPQIRSRLWHRTVGDPQDVPDAHSRIVGHGTMLSVLSASLDRLAPVLRSVDG